MSDQLTENVVEIGSSSEEDSLLLGATNVTPWADRLRSRERGRRNAAGVVVPGRSRSDGSHGVSEAGDDDDVVELVNPAEPRAEAGGREDAGAEAGPSAGPHAVVTSLQQEREQQEREQSIQGKHACMCMFLFA